MRYRLIAGTINRYVADDGWENVHLDIADRPIHHEGLRIFVRPDVVADISDRGGLMDVSLRGGLFDEIWFRHVLEHIPPVRAQAAVDNLYWLLKPGGTLDVEVPDVDAVAAAWRVGTLSLAGLEQWLYGEDLGENGTPADSHRSAWTEDRLRDALAAAGFEPGDRIDAGHAVRFFARKPDAE